MSWRTTLIMVVIGVLSACVAWTSLTVGAHLYQDHQDHHLVLELLRYNIQQGRLVPLTAGAQSPPPAAGTVPAAPSAPSGKK
jgi:hypothetical protein